VNSIPQADKEILQTLGREIAKLANDPINEERRKIHKDVLDMKAGRPSITIYQEPWNELNNDGSLDIHCTDPFCMNIERNMRQQLYKWRIYPGDMIINAESLQPRCYSDTGFGITEDSHVEKTSTDSVASRHFNIQISSESDFKKIKKPIINSNEKQTEEEFQKRCEIFDGILHVRKCGVTTFWFAPWDLLVCWTGVQEVLMDMVLRPDYVNKLISHLTDCWIAKVDQLEEQNLLENPPKEMEVSGAAQIFSEVSPEMHGEFALQHEARFYKRFKKVHYGCCEPLHNKVDICAEYLPNMYQISMSPWVDFEIGAANVRNRFIFGWRPNPAFLAPEKFDSDVVRKDIETKLAIANAHGCTMAIYLKDISTVANEPQRLSKWNQIAKECVEKYS